MGTIATSSNNSMASAQRPTRPSVPVIWSTIAVDESASASPSASAPVRLSPQASSKAPMSAADSTSSPEPTPNTSRRIAHRRRKLSSSPMEKSSSTMPSSASGAMRSSSLMVTQASAGQRSTSAPSTDGPTSPPTRMTPITGEMRKRAKAGMTMPAAPRMTSASEKPDVGAGTCMSDL